MRSSESQLPFVSESKEVGTLIDDNRGIFRCSHSNGSNQTVLDLAKLDPVTLANLFTKFLGALPHPVLTHHLFGLFVATSRAFCFSLLSRRADANMIEIDYLARVV